MIDEDDGVVRTSNLGWKDLTLAADIGARTGGPVRIRNDVRVATLAELHLGVGREHRTFAFAAVGTGLSVALVAGGAVHPGARWSAGEVGQPAPDGGPAIEARCSAPGIERRYAGITGGPAVRASEVLRRARSGDVAAHEVASDAIDALAEALAWTTTVFDPDPIVLGGGLGEAGPDLAEPLAAELDARLGWRRAPALVPATFGDRSGWIGAALDAWTGAGEAPDRFPVARP